MFAIAAIAPPTIAAIDETRMLVPLGHAERLCSAGCPALLGQRVMFRPPN
jgi:hypothetical protein